jgi:hypothetical protein
MMKSYIVSNAYGLTNVLTIFLIDTEGTVKVSSTGFDKKDLEATPRNWPSAANMPRRFRPDRRSHQQTR